MVSISHMGVLAAFDVNYSHGQVSSSSGST